MQAGVLFWVSLGALWVVYGQIVPGPTTCPKGTRFCVAGKYSRCLRDEYQCDGTSNCEDMSDEKNCTECSPTAFKCSGKCVSKKDLCDGYQRCPDGKDEVGCGIIVETLRKNDRLFFCNDGTSRRKSVRCDGTKNCPNGEDELGCTAEMCQGGAFFCDGKCKVPAALCDGYAHCKDGMDELDCPVG